MRGESCHINLLIKEGKKRIARFWVVLKVILVMLKAFDPIIMRKEKKENEILLYNR
jgi:hypothetical protein